MSQVVEIFKLLLVHDTLHLFENGIILLFEGLLVDSQLLLAQHQGLMFLLNFVHQISYQILKLVM